MLAMLPVFMSSMLVSDPQPRDMPVLLEDRHAAAGQTSLKKRAG